MGAESIGAEKTVVRLGLMVAAMGALSECRDFPPSLPKLSIVAKCSIVAKSEKLFEFCHEVRLARMDSDGLTSVVFEDDSLFSNVREDIRRSNDEE